MIAIEATMAAAKALRDKYADEVCELPIHNFFPEAKAALDAAAPILMSQAWEEGMRWADTLQSGKDLSDNPYQKETNV